MPSGRRMLSNSTLASIGRKIVRWHYFGYIERYTANHGATLEFGCGGGNRWLEATYDVTGMDFGLDACAAPAQVYRKCVAADVSAIPLADATFDCVCSSFVLEHLPSQVAEAAFEEVRRVLKPGGVFVSLLDLECDQPLFRYLRTRHPSTYSAGMIDVPSHRGLVREGAWLSMAERAGFGVRIWKLQTRIPVLDLATYAYFASTPQAPRLLQRFGRVCDKLARNRVVAPAYSVALTMLDRALGPLCPRVWAYRLLFVLQK